MNSEAESVVEAMIAASDKPKKKGKEPKKRRASSYVVLKNWYKQKDEVIDPLNTTVENTIEKVAEGNSIKECMDSISRQKIVGKLLICCVRRRLTTSVQEVLKFN